MSINPLNDISRVYLEQVATDCVTEVSADLALRASKEAGKRAGIYAGLSGGDPKVVAKAKKKRAQAERLYTKQAKKRVSSVSPIKEEDTAVDCVTEVSADLALKASKEAGKRAGIYAGLSGGDPKVVAKAKKKREQSERLYTKQAKKRVSSISPIKEEEKDVKRWWDDDGDGKGYEKGEVSGKFKKKKIKEGFSNWRQELIEVADVIEKEENHDKITEKKVKNKIKINPTMSEAVENLGGTLLEMVEVDEMDYILESVYDELLEEGYGEDDIEEAIEYSLTEAKVTFGHDTALEKKRSGLMTAAKARLSSLKKSAKQAVATGARKVAKGALKVARKIEGGDKTPSAAHSGTRKASTYRGAGAGQKERVSSGSYTPPTKKKSEKPADPWEGSETTPAKPKAKTKKAPAAKAKTTKVSDGDAKVPAKRRRKSKLDDLLASVRSEEVHINEKVLTAAETRKKEELVKKMKKSSSDFEKRYPGRGKEVMYATATKMAKRIAEQALEMQSKTSSTEKPDQQKKKVQQQQDRMKQQEVQILQRKLQALRSAPKGTDPSITAGYEPEGDVISERTRQRKIEGKPRPDTKSISHIVMMDLRKRNKEGLMTRSGKTVSQHERERGVKKDRTGPVKPQKPSITPAQKLARKKERAAAAKRDSEYMMHSRFD